MVEEDFPSAIIINCYFHMCKNVINKHTSYLNNKSLKNAILSDIKKLQKLSCAEDIEKGFDLIKGKYPAEVDYFNQFEESYWTGYRRNWLSAYLEPGVPRTNNACERYNKYFKENFTFRKLSKPSEFLQHLQKWGKHESYYHSSLYATSPMEHVRFKTNGRAITRINNVYRRGQYQNFHFFNLGNDLHVLKTAFSRQNHPNTDVNILNEQYVEQYDVDNFDSFYSRMRLVYYIDNDDDVWTCTCPYFSKYACCKHIIRFKKHVLGIPVSEMYDMTVLTPRAKRGRRKNIPRALVVMEHDPIIQNNGENVYSSDDESELSEHDMVLDEFTIPAEV